jgi:uncharacterized protein YciI
MQQFLIRQIAPRPAFAQSMSDPEKKLMDEHSGYWKKLQEQGVALIHRSAFEIKGAWGIGIIETENLSKAQVIAANDPAVKAGLHTIEVSPINASIPQDLPHLRIAGSPDGPSFLQKK